MIHRLGLITNAKLVLTRIDFKVNLIDLYTYRIYQIN